MAGGRRASPVRSVLRRRDFRLLLTGVAVSASGDWLYVVALTVYVLERTGSPAYVAALAIVRLVPYPLFGTLGGVVADRFDRRAVMIGTDLARAAVMFILTVVVASGGPVLVVLALAALASTIATAYLPAAAAITPSLVSEDDLAAANSLRETVENFALLAGPALGAILLTVGPAPLAVALNGLTFLASAAAAVRIRTRAPAGQIETEESLGTRIATGLRAIKGSRQVALLVALIAGTGFVYGNEYVLWVLASRELLGVGAEGFGYFATAAGLGGLLAAGLTSRLGDLRNPATALMVAAVVIGLPLASLAVITQPLVAYAVVLVQGAGTITFDVLAVTMLQRIVARDVTGRVFGVLDSLAAGAVLVGSVIASTLVATAGLRAALAVGGLSLPALALAAGPRLRTAGQLAERRRLELAERVDLLDRLRIFEGAPRAALEAVAEDMTRQPVQAGDVVVREGDPAAHLYVVESGDFTVTSTGEAGGRPVAVNRLGPGDYFGEIGLLHRISRTASVIAEADGAVYRIDGDDFLAAVSQAPRLPGVLSAGVTRRLAVTHPSRVAATESPPRED